MKRSNVFPRGLPSIYQTIIDDFTSSDFLTCNQRGTVIAAINFCHFLIQHNVISIKDVSYAILAEYHSFIRNSPRAYQYYENRVGVFLDYLYQKKGIGRVGFSLYMDNRIYNVHSSINHISKQDMLSIKVIQNSESLKPAAYIMETLDEFKKQLVKAGYSQNFIGTAIFWLENLYLFLDCSALLYNNDVAVKWINAIKLWIPEKKAIKIRRIMDLHNDYVTTGQIEPEKQIRHKVSSYSCLPNWCRARIDSFLLVLKKEGMSEKTIYGYKRGLSRFCTYLTENDISSFSSVTETVLKAYILYGKISASTRNGNNCQVRKFIIHLELDGIVPAGIHYALPRRSADKETIVTIASNNDLKKISEFSDQASTPIDLRDAAILQLELATALRASDMVRLRKANIDWKRQEIIVVQSKTHQEHRHYVETKVLNALYRYLKDGRHKGADNDYIFISTVAPYGPLSPTVCNRAMQRAGCSVSDFHRLRRTYATNSLRAGATVSETAELLGHSNKQSLHRYLALDSDQMYRCPLSMYETGLTIEGRYRSV